MTTVTGIESSCRLEQKEGVARAALLETAGALQILQLAKQPHAGDFRKRDRLRARRDVDRARDARPRGLDVSKGNSFHGANMRHPFGLASR
jgi:hypothetical protein